MTASSAAFAVVAVVALPATQAHAAYPTCNSVKNRTYSGGSVVQPYYTGTGTFNCTMGYGAQSSAVRKLQDHLINCYGFDGSLDGIYGRQTKTAIEGVQAREGAGVDGEYGPETRRKMKWSVATGSGYRCLYPGI